eukprot:271328_1
MATATTEVNRKRSADEANLDPQEEQPLKKSKAIDGTVQKPAEIAADKEDSKEEQKKDEAAPTEEKPKEDGDKKEDKSEKEDKKEEAEAPKEDDKEEPKQNGAPQKEAEAKETKEAAKAK